MDCPSTSFCRPHYGGRCTLGVETTQPQAVRWDNRSKRVSDNFLTQANLYTNDDAILCRIFPTSLKGATLTWYGLIADDEYLRKLMDRFGRTTVQIRNLNPDGSSSPYASTRSSCQCYVESLKVAPYPSIREPSMPYPTAAEGTHVMTVDEGSQIRALTQVTYMQKHITMSPVRATHSKWHVCMSTVLKTQVGQFHGQSFTGLAKPKVRPW
ncbi:hypothetical protein JHK82_024811 [Glycine max]|nr:hypothetical protein JHK82_024811 [Glycine max]